MYEFKILFTILERVTERQKKRKRGEGFIIPFKCLAGGGLSRIMLSALTHCPRWYRITRLLYAYGFITRLLQH